MKLVKEYINFERGKDPKDAMDIGLWNSIIPEQMVSAQVIQSCNINMEGLPTNEREPFFRIERGEIYIILLLNDEDFKYKIQSKRTDKMNGDDKAIYLSEFFDIQKYFRILKLIKEYINFERGIKPKKAMDIGIWENIPDNTQVQVIKNFRLRINGKMEDFDSKDPSLKQAKPFFYATKGEILYVTRAGELTDPVHIIKKDQRKVICNEDPKIMQQYLKIVNQYE